MFRHSNDTISYLVRPPGTWAAGVKPAHQRPGRVDGAQPALPVLKNTQSILSLAQREVHPPPTRLDITSPFQKLLQRFLVDSQVFPQVQYIYPGKRDRINAASAATRANRQGVFSVAAKQ